MKVSLYPQDASNIKGNFLPVDTPIPNQLASWTTVSPSVAKVKAHSTLIATVTIKVPSSAKNGEQFAVVWAAISTSPNSNAVGGISRVGIRMYTPVGDASTSTSTTKPDMTNWFQDHASAYEFGGVISLLLSLVIIGAVLARRERKLAKKRRKKQRDGD